MNKRIHYFSFLAIAILAVVDIASESRVWFTYFVPVFAVIPVLLTYLAAVILKATIHKGTFFWIASYLNIVIGLVAWAYYAFNGTSDPSTAAHMHVVLFPIIHGILSVCLIVMACFAELIAKGLKRER